MLEKLVELFVRSFYFFWVQKNRDKEKQVVNNYKLLRGSFKDGYQAGRVMKALIIRKISLWLLLCI